MTSPSPCSPRSREGFSSPRYNGAPARSKLRSIPSSPLPSADEPKAIRQLILTGTWAGEVSASVAARGPMPPDAMRVAAAPVTGQHGPHAARDGAKTAGCGGCHQARVSNGRGQTVPDERHVMNALAEAPVGTDSTMHAPGSLRPSHPPLTSADADGR